MKLSAGAKWGALTGLVFGLLSGVVGYLAVESIKPQLLESMYRKIVESGTPPEVARQAVQLAAGNLGVWALVGSVLGNLIVLTIVGLIMAAVWDRLKLPWYGKGAIFSLALLLISVLPAVLVKTPNEPAPPAVFQAVGALLTFAGPLVLAWLLERRGG
ncbi:hypothetical protein ODS41_11420 [Pyrobaculum sp. 3827-6]|uniref:hypothetical protein n=1 Tax=Pyrobaculum sp. 3827-6 TaxID=2983604 RepID=UPI0021DABE55|nr:hypothetical protein [Pyrobaculum sp. 3827-6]MCU7788520.1 hypothetical protein [Pyrobaculum sp. 3827-6]